MRDPPANHKRGKNPVCIVFDYSRTLTQKEFPVGLRSWLMREYGDDTHRVFTAFMVRGGVPHARQSCAGVEETGRVFRSV